MKSIQKVTRIQLKTKQNEEFLLFGIVSSDPDYKLSLLLNRKFRISLKNNSPVVITDEKGHEQIFSRFSDLKKSPDMIYNLLSNRSGKYFLLKRLKNIDYILLVQDSYNKAESEYFSSGLRDIETITAVFSIDTGLLNDKQLQYLTQ